MAAPLTDDLATRDGLITALHNLKEAARKGDLVLVTISGHGEKVGDNFCILSHEYDRKGPPELTAVPRYDITRKLGELPCKAVVLLDACHSGAVAKYMQYRDRPTRQADVKQSVDKSGATRGVVVAACMSGQLAAENRAWGKRGAHPGVLRGRGRAAAVRRQVRHPAAQADGRPPAVNWRHAVNSMRDRVTELTGEGGQSVSVASIHNIDLAKIRLAGRR